MCSHINDTISVLSNLSRPTDPKQRIEFGGDPRMIARYLDNLMVP